MQAILLEFGQRPDMRIWRQNTGAAKRKNGPLIRFGIPGMADISGIRNDGKRIEIECKSPTAPDKKKNQHNWREMIRAMNGIYIVARSVEDVRRVLDG